MGKHNMNDKTYFMTWNVIIVIKLSEEMRQLVAISCEPTRKYFPTIKGWST